MDEMVWVPGAEGCLQMRWQRQRGRRRRRATISKLGRLCTASGAAAGPRRPREESHSVQSSGHELPRGSPPSQARPTGSQVSAPVVVLPGGDARRLIAVAGGGVGNLKRLRRPAGDCDAHGAAQQDLGHARRAAMLVGCDQYEAGGQLHGPRGQPRGLLRGGGCRGRGRRGGAGAGGPCAPGQARGG